MKLYVKYVLLCTTFFISLLPLAGCWDANEPERMVYIQGLGVDYKDGEFVVYLQMLNPGLIAKSEATSGVQQSTVVVGRGSGKTVNEAAFDVYRSSQRRLFWGHLSFFIFTEEALKNKALEKTIDLFDRYRETRYGIDIFATKEPLFDMMTTLPALKASTAYTKLNEPEASYKQSSFVKHVDMRELLIALNEPPHETTIPYVEITKKSWKSDEGMKPAIQMAGIASITTKKLKDVISYENMKGLRWLNNDLKRAELSIKVKELDISLLVEKVKAKKKPIVKGNDIHFKLSIDVTVLLREIATERKLNEIEKSAEKVIKQEVIAVYKEGLKTDSDLFRLSETLYREDVQAWKKINKNGKIPLTTDSIRPSDIQVKVKMIRGERQRRLPTI
ncbi:Ger(x)C family spore germination protein [Bacillus sp. FJAT-42315]|uniref:Ger(x)C family spore germination protein n=2 Tax=Bacillus sp. FJAT-42315 TaxID=2014077 RepID=UPI000C241E96|nr:Ger(x)C family spore germination protein [Bacillus sp. FJAT-42315]